MKIRACRVAMFAAFIGPVVVAAQAPERAGYYMLSGRDTIFAERSERTATELSGEIVDRVRGSRITYRAVLSPLALVTQLDTRIFANAGDTVGRKATLRSDGDSLIADIGAGPVHVPSTVGALLYINGSSAFMEQIILHARAIGPKQTTVLYPLFITSVGQTAPLTVHFLGADSATIDFGNVAVRVTISPTGRFLAGTVPAQNITITRVDDVRVGVPDRYGFSFRGNALRSVRTRREVSGAIADWLSQQPQ